MYISKSSLSSFCSYSNLVIFEQVCKYFACMSIFYQSSYRHQKFYVFSVWSIFVFGHSRISRLSSELFFVSIRHQRPFIFARTKNDRATFTSISSGRASSWYFSFASSRDTTIASFSRVDSNSYLIKEFHVNSIMKCINKKSPGRRIPLRQRAIDKPMHLGQTTKCSVLICMDNSILLVDKKKIHLLQILIVFRRWIFV